MHAHAIASNVTSIGTGAHPATVAKITLARKPRDPGLTWARALNGRHQPIRGLWVRNGRYYARLNAEDPQTGIKEDRRVPLLKDGQPITSLTEAQAELRELLTKRRNNELPALQRNPKLADYVKTYLDFIKSGEGTKKASSISKEAGHLQLWTAKFGELRLNQIRPYHLNLFTQERRTAGIAGRTINLDMIALRNVFKHARQEGRINRLPMEGMKPLKTNTPKRPFFNAVDLNKLCQSAFETKTAKRDGKETQIPLTKNAQELCDYIRLMAYCGARRNEALGFQWADVDFDNEQLHVRRQITSRGIQELKNREERVVDFNPKLKAHLIDLHRRRAPDSQWLFPSPQRGKKDVPSKNFRESLDLVRTRAGLPAFQFHDCRHHFISMCVMSGVDFMTIAAWAGHRDGGVLIGKVYGHLANEHRKRMAERVAFEPEVLPRAVNQ